MHKTRINLANPEELLELPGIRQAEADAIIRHRALHGPISDAAALTQILRPEPADPCPPSGIRVTRARPRSQG